MGGGSARPGVLAAVAVAAGIAAGAVLPAAGRTLLVAAAVAAAGWARRRPGVALLLALVAWGGWRAPPLPPLDALPEGRWAIEGRLLDHGRATAWGWRFPLRVDRAVLLAGSPGAATAVPRRVVVEAPAGTGPPPGWGARVRLSGRFRPLPGYRNPDVFSYPEYLRRQGFAARFAADAPPRPDGDGWDRWPGTVRARVEAALVAGGGPQAGLLRALALGDGSALTEEQRRRWDAAGLAHALAASGLNVGVVAWLAGWLLGRLVPALSPPWHHGLVVAAVAAYGLLVGPSPSLLRAAAFFLVLRALRAGGRPADGLNALGLATAAILAASPAALFDTGFRLSVLAAAGLLALPSGPSAGSAEVLAAPGDPSVRPRVRRGARGLLAAARAAVRASAAAQLAVLPVLAGVWGQLAWAAPWSNALLLPPLTALLPAALAAAAVACLWPAAGAALAAVVARPAAWLDAAAGLFASLPGARQPLPPLPAWAVPAYYGALAAVLWDLRHDVVRRRLPRRLGPRAWLASLLLVAAALPAGAARAPRGFEVAFLDVGQGDAIVIRSPPGLVAVVDAGEAPAGNPRAAERALVPYLRATGVGAVHLLVATHYDADHAGGIPAVAAALPVGALMVPSPEAAADPADRRLAARLLSLPVPMRVVPRAPLRFPLGAARVEVLPPDPGARGNDGSLVLRVCYAGRAVLLTGDAGWRREVRWLRDGVAVDAEVLKVSHHGSATGTGAHFLAAVRPWLAVIQVGRGNPYGLPNRQVVARLEAAGARVLRTDRDGGVRVRVDPRGRVRVWTRADGWQALAPAGGGPGWPSSTPSRRCGALNAAS